MSAVLHEIAAALAGTGGVGPPRAVLPLVALLRQLAELLEALTDGQYARKPVGVVSSSIGGHVRHSLDHFEALLGGLSAGAVDYDRRQRGTDVEHCRKAALEAINRLEQRLLASLWVSGSQPLRLSVLLTPDGPRVEVTTTLERELAYVLSHTTHHNALIAVMARLLGVALPSHFGYAPSTVAHRERA
ncbi:MAG: DinB family protein [Planctomycetes bacterium]|nr:DinB family protein [Planctomycetota bacterium]